MNTPKYLCFTRDHNLEAALQTFRDRYHLEPKTHQYQYGILMVGPVPGSDENYAGNMVELRDQDGDKFQLLMF